jgi:hypothetical protein
MVTNKTRDEHFRHAKKDGDKPTSGENGEEILSPPLRYDSQSHFSRPSLRFADSNNSF